MRITVRGNVTITASVARVWEILAEQFQDVATWASTISHSGPGSQIPAAGLVSGIETAGRSCTVPGFGVTEEKFTEFDAVNHTYTYSATASGMPKFVDGVENTWAVRDLGAGRVEVTTTARATVHGALGTLLGPMMWIQLRGTLQPALADLRVYAETGQVSAAKRKAAKRVAAGAGR